MQSLTGLIITIFILFQMLRQVKITLRIDKLIHGCVILHAVILRFYQIVTDLAFVHFFVLLQDAGIHILHHEVHTVILVIDINLGKSYLWCGDSHLGQNFPCTEFLQHTLVKIEVIKTYFAQSVEILGCSELFLFDILTKIQSQ